MLAPVPRFFLDVRRSATGQAWTPRLDERGERVALTLAQGGLVEDAVARVLAGRGVGPDAAAVFLNPTLRETLPDPLSLTDMQPAAERLAVGIARGERVAVFGDYDVDGAASAALLKRFLAHYGVAADVYIPDRIFEGYGPNPAAMRELASRGATLIVTVDCGSTSLDAIAAAREAGADVIVLDHHGLGSELPPASAIVNPSRGDDLSGQSHLCAAGVVFLCLVRAARLLRELQPRTEPMDLLNLIDLVGLATVCDVVPLIGVNRTFVLRGLDVMRARRNVGLAALAEVSRIAEPVNARHLGFLLGPRINAGGRIGDAALGSRLLSTDDPGAAAAIAATLERLNRERQSMEEAMLAEARAEAEAELAGASGGPAILVTASESWHPGVVGLIASRLKDQARRPAFAIALGRDGSGVGSGRSVPGLDLGRLVREAVAEGLLIKGGGHAMAAGVTVKRERLGALRAFFEDRAAGTVARLTAECSLVIDAALSAEGATEALYDAVERAGPYGAGNPAPVFALPRHRIADLRPVGSGHLQLDLRSPGGGRIRAVAFRSADTPLGRFLEDRRGATIHAAGTLSASVWNGNRRIEMKIIDAASD